MPDTRCVTLIPTISSSCTVTSDECFCVAAAGSSLSVLTNPSEVCGTSALWEYSASPTGPWGPAFDINTTCGLSTNVALGDVPGAGWVAPTASGAGVAPGPHYFRHQLTLTAQQAADVGSTMTGGIVGDLGIVLITINGTAVYAGTPTNMWNQAANGITLPTTGLAAGVNDIVVTSNYDGFVSDGISINLTIPFGATNTVYRRRTYDGGCPDDWFLPDLTPIATPSPLPTVSCDCGTQPLEITVDPVDQNTTAGGTVTFTSGHTGGVAPVAGCWEELSGGTWQTIPGETGDTLTVTEG